MSRAARSLAVLALLVAAPGLARAGDPAEHYQRSYDLEASGEPARALLARDAIDAEERASYFYRRRRGWLLYLAGRHWDALGEYRKASRLAPRSVEAHLGMSLPQVALRLWLDARATCEAVVALDPQNYTALGRLAYIDYNLGRYASAEGLYRQLLVAYPADIELRVGLAWSLFQQQKFAEALVEFVAVRRVAPRHPYNRPPAQPGERAD